MIEASNIYCCGCTACASTCRNGAIVMMENRKGFLEPCVDVEKCVKCGMCEDVCPLNAIHIKNDKHIFIAAKHKDIVRRNQSQSGGAFVAMAEHTIKQKGIIYGVYLDDKFRAAYRRVERLRDIKLLTGSKYIQARLDNSYDMVLNDLKRGKHVLFSGTPCHVDGLKRFLDQNKVPTGNLISVDLVCHGVPSPMIYKEYLDLFQIIHNRRVTGFNFRSKAAAGWHGHVALVRSGVNQYRCDDFVKYFYSHYALRDSCYFCNYANLNRVGDITIGDCWGIEKTNPDFDDNMGISLVIINTEKGMKIWNEISSNFVSLRKRENEIMQHNLKKPTTAPEDLESFWQDYNKYGCEYVLRHYCGCNPDDLKEYIDNKQYFRRLARKMTRLFKRCFYM